jgi:hypothetical protein
MLYLIQFFVIIIESLISKSKTVITKGNAIKTKISKIKDSFDIPFLDKYKIDKVHIMVTMDQGKILL